MPVTPDDDPKYLFESVLSLLDNGWACQLRKRQECKDANLKTIIETMNQILLILFPILTRRIEYSRMQMYKAEDPSNFLKGPDHVIKFFDIC